MRRLKDEAWESVAECFADLEDPRTTINRRHLFMDIIVLSVLGTIAGCDGPLSIALWAEVNEKRLRKYLTLPNGIPSHDTIGRTLAAVSPTKFQKCFEGWIEHIHEIRGIEVTEGQKQIAIDGKAVRRSHEPSKGIGPMSLVSAWSVDKGLSLGQVAAEAKSNEITAIPELIETLDIAGASVTIDAAGCQKNIAALIIDKGADYDLALKRNQRTLHRNVSVALAEALAEDGANSGLKEHVATYKGHGRTETVRSYQMAVPDSLSTRSQWAGMQSIGMVIRDSTKDGETEPTTDIRYYISSHRVSAKKFAERVRNHWAIENTLHWCLDVTFREDECRIRERRLANNIAWLKRFALGVLKQVDHKQSVAMKRRKAGWSIDYLFQIVGLQRT